MKQIKVVLQVVSLVFYISGTLLAADYSGEYYSWVKLTCKFKMNGTSSGSGSVNMKVSGSLSCKLRAKMELEPASNKYSKSRYELISIDNDFLKDILAEGSLLDIILELETLMMNQGFSV